MSTHMTIWLFNLRTSIESIPNTVPLYTKCICEWLHSCATISTYKADDRNNQQLSKVQYFISFRLVSTVHAVRVYSVHYPFTVTWLKKNDSYFFTSMSIFCSLDRFKACIKSEILCLYSNIFTVFPKKNICLKKTPVFWNITNTSLPGLRWRWKPQAPPKSWHMHTNLHGVVTQKTGFNISTVVITPKVAQYTHPPNTRNPQIFQNPRVISKYRRQKS